MRTTLKSAEDTMAFPAGMSRENVLEKLRIVLTKIGWTFTPTRGGFSATTPLSMKSTGEKVDVEVGSNDITVRSSGGQAVFALTSKKFHVANVELIFSELLSISSVAAVFNHNEFLDKIQKSYILSQAGVLDPAEFKQTKTIGIQNLSRNSLSVPATAFLMELAPFIEAGAITMDELATIKQRIL